VPEDEVYSAMQRLLKLNLENLLVALRDKESEKSIQSLIRRAQAVKKQGLSREDKRQLIAQDLESLQTERRKIIDRYFRGYPKEKE